MVCLVSTLGVRCDKIVVVKCCNTLHLDAIEGNAVSGVLEINRASNAAPR